MNDSVLTLALAERAIAAARRKAEELGVRLAIAVVDVGGHPVALARMDGTPWITPEVAISAAATATAFGVATVNIVQSAAKYPAFWQSIMARERDRLLMAQSGVPITSGGAVIGGIGCSGATGEQDAECARAGAESIA